MKRLDFPVYLVVRTVETEIYSTRTQKQTGIIIVVGMVPKHFLALGFRRFNLSRGSFRQLRTNKVLPMYTYEANLHGCL